MADRIIRVLYVDDDAALVHLVQRALRRRGFEVVHAANAEEAVERIGAGAIDVVALDHYLASGTGLDVLALLTAAGRAPPVVYVTGSSEMNVAVAALKAGASDFVPKTTGDDFLTLLGSSLEQAVEKARLISEKEAAEVEVRAARDRAELLLAEVNHRVANSLALVSSLVALQANALTDQAARDALEETQARILAISSVHKRLYSSADVRAVELDQYLTSLLENLQVLMRGQGHGASLEFSLEPLKLGPDATIKLGVVVTELVTNAFKYAYGEGYGEVRVRLRRIDDGRAELSVEDDGVGMSGSGPAKGTGLGGRIIRAMSSGMGARIEYVGREPGTLARLTFALPA